MANGGLLNATCGIDEPGFAIGQQAGDFFEHGVEKLIFGDGFDDFALAEDDAFAFATGKPYIGVARFAGTKSP